MVESAVDMEKSVLIAVTGDPITLAHVNLIEEASKYGKVSVAVIGDAACQGHRQQPAQTLDQRIKMLGSFEKVHSVFAQHSWSYSSSISSFKPDYFVHSNDWNFSLGEEVRAATIQALDDCDGKLIEIDHSSGIAYDYSHSKKHLLPESRRSTLANLMTLGRCLAFIEAHSPMSALIAEKFRRVHGDKNGLEKHTQGFDGLWSSSLADSTVRGVPDTEKLDFSQRMANISEIFQTTTLPMIYDADTGGHIEHLTHNIRQMENMGISACIIEDKNGLKRNSLLGTDVTQTQDEVGIFSNKISTAVQSRTTSSFLIFARIESLILEKGLKDAELRANSYVSAGASGIMIHSRDNRENEIAEFARQFKMNHPKTPLVVVPTGYNSFTLNEIEDWGVDIVIYANHMLRASYQAMMEAAQSILIHGRTMEIDSKITNIRETLRIVE